MPKQRTVYIFDFSRLTLPFKKLYIDIITHVRCKVKCFYVNLFRFREKFGAYPNIIVKKQKRDMFMKKLLKLLALCLLTASILTSCTKNTPNATDLLFEALDTLDTLPAYEIYYSGAPQYSESIMDSEKSELLYRNAQIASYAESFACVLGEDDAIWEIHVFVALSAGDAAFIENALAKRLDMLQSREIYIYDSEVYEARVADAKVFRDGKVVCLTVCDENSQVLKTIKKVK